MGKNALGIKKNNMKSSGFKMKGFSGFGNSPAKHIRSKEGHNEKYHKTDKTNKAHPDYWKTEEAEETRRTWIGHGPGKGELKPGYPKMVDGQFVHKYWEKD